jgi:hypothetical protein
MKMLRKVRFRARGHYATLRWIFEDPPPAKLTWSRIKELLCACMIKIPRSRKDDGTYLLYGEVSQDLKTPEFDTLSKGTINAIRDFLGRIGATPVDIWNFLGLS